MNFLKLSSLFFILWLLNACSPTSDSDFKAQSCHILKSFTSDLKKVHDPLELKKKQHRIKKHFDKLAQLLIEYRSFLEKNPQVEGCENPKLIQAAYNLKCELYRIYKMDGGQLLMEEAQKDAYLKLSLFEHSLTHDTINMYESHRPLTKV